MKKCFCVFLSACLVCSIFAVQSSAVEAPTEYQQTDFSNAEQFACLDIDTASPEMQEKILEARNGVIFSQEWVADGYTSYVQDVRTGEVLREIPSFSSVFPDWDIPVLDTAGNQNRTTLAGPFKDASNLIRISSDAWLRLGNFRYYLPTSAPENANPFTSFTVDPFEMGTEVRAYATELTASKTCNIGFSNPSTGKSYVSATNLSINQSVNLGGLWNTDVAVRASTFSSPGWATIAVDAAYRASIARDAD